jgi:hypothetical protein
MTSPSVCWQRVYDRQTRIPQPNFGIPVQQPANLASGSNSYMHNGGAQPMPAASGPAYTYHWPVPVHQYPGLTHPDIAYHQSCTIYRDQSYVQPTGGFAQPSTSYRPQTGTDWNAQLNSGFQSRHAERVQ